MISLLGRKPASSGNNSGFEKMISSPKQRMIVATKTITIASNVRNPLACNISKSRTSAAVMMTPTGRGMPNKRLRAMADPITSARSHAVIITSAMIQSMIFAHFGKVSLQACARSRPDTIPSFAERYCRRIAKRFESKITKSSVYPKLAPPARSVAQFPGSM